MGDIVTEGITIAHSKYQETKDPIIPVILHFPGEDPDYLCIEIIPKPKNRFSAAVKYVENEEFLRLEKEHKCNVVHLHLHESIDS